jgi:hypothetical protein
MRTRCWQRQQQLLQQLLRLQQLQRLRLQRRRGVEGQRRLLGQPHAVLPSAFPCGAPARSLAAVVAAAAAAAAASFRRRHSPPSPPLSLCQPAAAAATVVEEGVVALAAAVAWALPLPLPVAVVAAAAGRGRAAPPRLGSGLLAAALGVAALLPCTHGQAACARLGDPCTVPPASSCCWHSHGPVWVAWVVVVVVVWRQRPLPLPLPPTLLPPPPPTAPAQARSRQLRALAPATAGAGGRTSWWQTQSWTQSCTTGTWSGALAAWTRRRALTQTRQMTRRWGQRPLLPPVALPAPALQGGQRALAVGLGGAALMPAWQRLARSPPTSESARLRLATAAAARQQGGR